ncbi:MAG TPA: hypothetical protein VN726_05530 [Hanamia sp.]|nr:hypothetical protein [Hanamia sp.]
MSLNNIQLTAETGRILFSKNLIETGDIIAGNETGSAIKISSLGENQKQILFLVNDSEHKFLADHEMELLTNLITACKLSMADIVLVNFHSNPFNYQQFDTLFTPKKILLFGVSTSEAALPFEIPFFQIQSYNSQQYLVAPALKDLAENKNLKKQLWISLQKLFQLA